MNGATNSSEWIVCELTNRWAAALRLAMEHDPRRRAGSVRLYETRQLAELTHRLTEQPHGFVVVEVRENNVAEVLGWLPWATGRFGGARCVALLDRSLTAEEADIVAALAEAGALDVARSTRQLHSVVELFWRHAALSNRADGLLAANLTWKQQVWQSLPWQAAGSQVG